MCLRINTWIPIPHFTLFRGKKVCKDLLVYADESGKRFYVTPYKYASVPDNGVMIPEKRRNTWVWSTYYKRWEIHSGYIHCYTYIDYFYPATIPPFTLYWKAGNEIACKKLIIHLPKD